MSAGTLRNAALERGTLERGNLGRGALEPAALEFGARIARMLCARGDVDAMAALRPALELCGALVLTRSLQGHAYLDFDAPVLLPMDAGVRSSEVVEFNEHRSALPALQGSGLLSAQPKLGDLLVLQGTRLYMRRLWESEVQLANALRERINAPALATEDAWLAPLVAASFSADSAKEQLAAVSACAPKLFSAITGGPGTGKTFVAARVMLAQAVGRALRNTQADGRTHVPRIALLAPTGKAARRVDASVAAAVESLQKPLNELQRQWTAAPPVAGAAKALDAALHALSDVRGRASTIHAALETDPRGADVFKRNAQRPLEADVVVVDEASMVSLSVMQALSAAVAPHAQLVLLGDPGQLQSIEAGSVLEDIAGSGEGDHGNKRMHSTVTHLRVSRRFPQESGLGKLAAAVRSSDAAQQAVALLEHDAQVRAQVTLEEPSAGAANAGAANAVTARAVELAWKRFATLRDPRSSPQERLRTLESFALLCAHRRGPGGADEINAALLRRFRPPASRGEAVFDGMPVLILRNSRSTGLSNGDVGVMCAERDTLVAHFAGGMRIRAEMLPEHAPAYALTVHKSQGSEYDEVALVLPERESPVLTRELIYTALTRWKAGDRAPGVTIMAQRTVLQASLCARVQRASGLRERL